MQEVYPEFTEHLSFVDCDANKYYKTKMSLCNYFSNNTALFTTLITPSFKHVVCAVSGTHFDLHIVWQSVRSCKHIQYTVMFQS